MRARASWILLTLVGICLLSSPVTQHVWSWDGFPRGGPDFETGSFLILVSCCLLMVLAHLCKSALMQALTVPNWLGFLLDGFPQPAHSPASVQSFRDECLFPPIVNLPLQI